MVEVYLYGRNIYAHLTGRWIISPHGLLMLEVCYKYSDFIFSKTYYEFVYEDDINLIEGERCAKKCKS